MEQFLDPQTVKAESQAMEQTIYQALRQLFPSKEENREVSVPFLETCYYAGFQSIRDTFVDWQSGEKQTQWHVARAAAILAIICFELEQHTDQVFWPRTYHSIKHYLPFQWDEREILAATHALLSSWREVFHLPYEQNANGTDLGGNTIQQDQELSLIQNAIESLPKAERGQAGRPALHAEPTVRLDGRIPFSMKQTLLEIQRKTGTSINEFVIRALLDYEPFQRFYKNPSPPTQESDAPENA